MHSPALVSIERSPAESVHPSLPANLVGEYLRLILGGTAAFASLDWAFSLGRDPSAPWMLLTYGYVLFWSISDRVGSAARLAFSLLGFVVLGVLISQGDAGSRETLPFFSPAVALGTFAVLIAFDSASVFSRAWREREGGEDLGRRSPSPAMLGGLAIAALVFAYMIAFPMVEAVWDATRERTTSGVVEELTWFEVLRIRSAKLAVFVIFAATGAAVGSFLNVVAQSLPRGESVAFRSSACPQCQTPIRRIDNLPIVSYLALAGRCRACSAPIPIRYWLVEITVAAIFGSLFLFELVTGAANVPGFRPFQYTGIVWILLYTKWDVVGIYGFHVAMLSLLLTLALMELDRLRPPRWFCFAMLLAFVAAGIAFPWLLPVAVGDQIPIPGLVTEGAARAANLPAPLAAAATAILGGALGSLGGVVLRRSLIPSASALPVASALIGVTLGWQATLTILLLFAGAIGATRIAGHRSSIFASTLGLMLIAWAHHPAWKFLAGLW